MAKTLLPAMALLGKYSRLIERINERYQIHPFISLNGNRDALRAAVIFIH